MESKRTLMEERRVETMSGWTMLVVTLAVLIGTPAWTIAAWGDISAGMAGLALAVEILFFVLTFGFFIVNPNESRVLQLFGRYVGTVRRAGFGWTNPFYSKRVVSLRVFNFETEKSKVNDLNGNPIEASMIVVWRIVDTARAEFEVEDVDEFVRLQSESALRNLLTRYPYDTADEDESTSLRRNVEAVSEELKRELERHVGKAGVEIIDTRIARMAYAPEIASAMLQRQQASAVVQAREQLVNGAVGIVERALKKLEEKEVVELDAERKATMVSNMLVVLCSEKGAQPVVNTGSLYQ